ncbi:hypothetical protein ACFS4T_06675 [Pseudomonas lini]
MRLPVVLKKIPLDILGPFNAYSPICSEEIKERFDRQIGCVLRPQLDHNFVLLPGLRLCIGVFSRGETQGKPGLIHTKNHIDDDTGQGRFYTG